MVTVGKVQDFIDSGEIVSFTYKNADRLVNPVEFLTTKGGETLLVGQEAGKGWRRYHLDGITNLQVAHVAEFVSQMTGEAFTVKETALW